MSDDVRTPKALLFLAFAAALLPRLYALDWALPLKNAHIDEGVVVFYSLRIAGGEPNVFFDYPGFFLYALAALFKVLLAASRAWGRLVPPDAEVLAAYTRGDGLTHLLLSARALSAVLGAATGVVIARLGFARGGLFVGLAAALLWAVNPLAVLHAHYATVDIAAVFLSLLAMERLFIYWEAGRLRDGMWSAAFTGVAAATKYYPAALAVFLAPAPFILSRRPWRSLGLLALCAAGSFCLANPGALSSGGAFMERFSHLFAAIITGRGDGPPAPRFLPTLAGLIHFAGFPACLAASGGIFFLLKSTRRGDKLTAALLLSLTLFIGVWRVQPPHYGLVLYPLLFLSAARGLGALARFQKVLPWGGMAIILALTLPKTVERLRTLSATDTRLKALAWAREAIPAGSRILRCAHTPEFTPRDPYPVIVDWENKRLSAGDILGFDYLLYSSFTAGGDEVSRGLANRFTLVHRVDDPKPEFPHHPNVFIYKEKP